MDNICKIWNSGNQSLGDSFHSEHMKYCGLYRQAASALADFYGNMDNSSADDIKTQLKQLNLRHKKQL